MPEYSPVLLAWILMTSVNDQGTFASSYFGNPAVFQDVVNVNVILLIEFSISALKITKLSLIAFPVDLQSNGVFQFLR